MKSGPSHVLLVDDDAALRERWVSWLGEGYDVSHAGDGYQAMTVALSRRPDLIVLDLELPRVSGYEVLHTLSGMQLDVPTLAVLPAPPTRPGDRLAPMVLGATEIVHKPIERFDFVNKCELLLRLESSPRRDVDPGEAKDLFDFSAHTRLVPADRFRAALMRAHDIGRRFDMASTVLAIEAPSAEVMDALTTAADGALRFEDAVHVYSKKRCLMLLVAAEQDNVDAVLARITGNAELDPSPGLLGIAAHDARDVAEEADWQRLFASATELGAESEGGSDEA